jgi:hypothetical protein
MYELISSTDADFMLVCLFILAMDGREKIYIFLIKPKQEVKKYGF